jgi:RNA polymerase sigma-70 factor (ECF subfamily)
LFCDEILEILRKLGEPNVRKGKETNQVGARAMKEIATVSRRPADRDAAFRQGLLELIPYLRAFARSLCRNRERAEDLAQEALTKAWQARSSFHAGSNLKAWLFTILHNQFYSDRRRAWREAHLDDCAAERHPAPSGEQSWAVELSDLIRAMHELPNRQREAVILVGAGGLSHKDAAVICDCAVGTIKSRVARARKALSGALNGGGQFALPARASYANERPDQQIMTELYQLTSLHV